jgi:hypothetical protein
MTSITPNRTLQTGDENPGGLIRHAGGFGRMVSAFNVQPDAPLTGETWTISGNSVANEAGGLRSQTRRNLRVVTSGIRKVKFDPTELIRRTTPGGVVR